MTDLPGEIVEAARDAWMARMTELFPDGAQKWDEFSDDIRAGLDDSFKTALSAIPFAEVVAALRTLEADNTGGTIDDCYCKECGLYFDGPLPSHCPECPFAILSHPRVKVMP